MESGKQQINIAVLCTLYIHGNPISSNISRLCRLNAESLLTWQRSVLPKAARALFA
jgi:hypothetical protein